VIRELVGPGRVARGEVLAFERFESTIDIVGSNGEVAAVDTVRLDGADGLGRLGLLGDHRCVGSLSVVHAGFGPGVLLAGAEAAAEAAEAAAAAVAAGAAGRAAGGAEPRSGAPFTATFGASTYPADAGAWLRVLAPDTAAAAAVLHGAWSAARRALLGAPPPPDHRF
jgi:urease accessory protein UreH